MKRSVLGCMLLWLAALPVAGSTLDDARNLHRAGQLDEALNLYLDVTASDAAAEDRAAAMNNACVILTDRSDLTAAEKLCDDALVLRRTIADQRRLARTLNNVARVQERLGNGDSARRHHREALSINTQLGDLRSQVISLTNLGVLETNAGHYAQALDQYRLADDILLANTESEWAPYQRALLTLNRGVVLEKIGAYRDALQALEQSLDIATTAAPDLLPDIQMNRGVVLRNLGDPSAALSAYRSALAAFETRADRAAVANVYLNQGLVHWLNRNDLEAALERFEQARALSVASGDVSAAREAQYFTLRVRLDRDDEDQAARLFATLDDGTDDWFVRDARARIAFAQGTSEAALVAALRAIDLIEDQRAALVGDTHRQTLLTDRRAAYALAIDILFERYQRTGATQDVQRARRIAGRAKALALLEATGRSDELLIDNTKDQHTSGHLLEFFVTQHNTEVWTVRSDTIVWRRFDTGPIADAALHLHSVLSRGESPGADAFAPLRPPIEDLDFARADLIVAPDGPLAAIPFDLLIAQHVGERSSPVAVRYSATAVSTANPPTENSPTLVAFAYGKLDTVNKNHPALRVLQSLPNVAREVTSVAAQFDQPAQVLVDDAASETALRNARVGPGDVLHIASHAVVDARLDDAAVLILGASASDDGLLFPRDVAALDLPVSLTVLSACSTAAGKGTVGAPMTNLAGAFRAAGSQAVLATLWPVDDAASAVVMEQFYAQLALGRSPNDALHAVKRRLATSEEWGSPSVWAGYVIYGDSGPLVAVKTHTRWYALFALALLGATLIFGWRHRVR
ncbi:MAG: CHAT domain-containing protein [Gammaproteobacteria bacterium]